MSILGNRILGGAGQQPYLVGRSLRFRSSASAYLSRTFAAAGDRQKFTYSFWTKRGALGSLSITASGWSGGGASQGGAQFYFAGNALDISEQTNNSYTWQVQTTQVFRDPSAWYHIVASVDTTQATASNRVKLYVNGVQITAFAISNYPSQNLNTKFNATNQRIAAIDDAGNPYLTYDGYYADFYFIDGQALTPSSFGAYDNNGIWQPIKYGGTYGTNGFYLPFSNTTSTTTLVQDASGNGNNWTANNISLTAGTTYDSMIDSPTNSNVGGNYCVLNPLNAATTLSNANLNSNPPSANWLGTVGTLGFPSGKFYYEATITATTNTVFQIFGAARSTISNATIASNGYPGATADGWGVQLGTPSYKVNNGTFTALGSNYSYTTNDVIMVAVDVDAGKFWYGKNGTWIESGDPATGTNALFTNLTTTIIPMIGQNTSGNSCAANFGQRPFTYTPPTGFNALNTYNLPQPTIMNGAKYMAATLWTGDGTNPRTITNTVNNAAFQPDFIWTKVRSTTYSNTLYDDVRGGANALFSDTTSAESQNYANGQILSFNSNGFNVNSGVVLNQSSQTYVGWQWNAGSGVTSTNTNGSITSLVSVNPTAGFSIVSYTGTGVNATVGHGLGVVPNMVIIKNRTVGTENWAVYHTSTGAGNWLLLSGTNAAIANTTIWQNTTPTSSVISLGPISNSNVAGSSFIGYFWSAVAGYSAFGSYTGNGSSDGPFVYTGFRPRWVMIKNITTGGANYDWVLIDSSREPYNVTQNDLAANTSASETSGILSQPNDFLSNGFKIRASGVNAYPTNASGSTYIYAAFAENPFKVSRAR